MLKLITLKDQNAYIMRKNKKYLSNQPTKVGSAVWQNVRKEMILCGSHYYIEVRQLI